MMEILQSSLNEIVSGQILAPKFWFVIAMFIGFPVSSESLQKIFVSSKAAAKC